MVKSGTVKSLCKKAFAKRAIELFVYLFMDNLVSRKKWKYDNIKTFDRNKFNSLKIIVIKKQ